jgi:DNA-binding MarR family transcriptional regulator
MDPKELKAMCQRVSRECTADNLRRASRAVAGFYDAAIAPTGLRGTQMSLLVAVSLAGEMPVSRLASLLGLDRTTLSRNLGPLERDGLLESLPGADARVRLVALSTKGRKALERALPRWQKAQEQVVRALGQPRWRELIEGLQTAASLSARPD